MKPAVGDRLEIEISKVVHGGWGLGRVDGFVTFVRGALPGERVVAQVTDAKKNHAFADALEVLSPSPHRQPHIWPEADISRPPDNRAGGADYGHIQRDYQLQLKAEILRDALSRFGQVDQSLVESASVAPIQGDNSGLNWRTRMGLHVGPDGLAGPYAEGSHRVIPVDTLPLATQGINQAGAHRARWEGHQSIRLVHPSNSEVRLVVDSQKPTEIVETVAGIDFALSDQSFWQVHRCAAEALFQSVTELLKPGLGVDGAEHWDLYGGVGLFARAILESLGPSSQVVTVESNQASSEFAGGNLEGFSGAKAVAQSTLNYLHTRANDSPRLGVVLLDPPRSGAKAEVVSAISAMAPEMVIYVACDPVALGRDLGLFAESGYLPTSIEGIDLFPHTHHFETIVRLDKGR